MYELSMSYWNTLANQILLITVLLGGFSIAVAANLMVYESSKRVIVIMLRLATVAAGCFLVNVFAMTKIIMVTTEGYPSEISEGDLQMPSLIGSLLFFAGTIALAGIISLAGYTKSRKTGVFTTIIGIVALVGIIFFLT